MEGPIAELVSLFARLPGIGERTAMRLAFHVLSSDASYANQLGQSLQSLHERVHRCELCGNFGARARCDVCLDPRRDPHLVCVVARVQDLIAIERTGNFRGRYHVLHALLAPLDGIGPDRLPIKALLERIVSEGIEEIIVATPLSVDGEATSLYLAQALKPAGVRLTRIASGVPHGGDLEFTDQITLGRAFEGRRDL
ncbi:MAG TPA: recombination mediator RecR [Polyangiales bacterium]|nr:recombination mediator RecR [Polyangiales bacterium]